MAQDPRFAGGSPRPAVLTSGKQRAPFLAETGVRPPFYVILLGSGVRVGDGRERAVTPVGTESDPASGDRPGSHRGREGKRSGHWKRGTSYTV